MILLALCPASLADARKPPFFFHVAACDCQLQRFSLNMAEHGLTREKWYGGSGLMM